MIRLVVRTAWQTLRSQQPDRFGPMVPRIVEVRARRGKVLPAEPVAQQWAEDRVRTAAHLPDLETEWATWRAGSTDSPGRIDASMYLALDLLPVPVAGASDASGVLTMTQVDLTTGLWRPAKEGTDAPDRYGHLAGRQR